MSSSRQSMTKKQVKARQKMRELALMAIREKNGGRGFVHAGQEPYLSTQPTVLKKLLFPKSNDILEVEAKGDGRNDDKGDISALDGRGIALGFRHQIEKHDPKHRPWKNGIYYQELGEKFETWQSDDAEKQSLFKWADKLYPETKDISVLYLSAKKASRYLVSTNQDQRLIYAAQNNESVDTWDYDQHTAIYVMDLQGNLFIANEGPIDAAKPKQRLQHPSFVAGERVLCAGKITVVNGRVTHINNESGHYLPGAFSLSRMVDELEKRGVLSSDVTISVRFQRLFIDQNKQDNISLAEFRDVMRVWPGSPLAKLDLSEKPNPYAPRSVKQFFVDCFKKMTCCTAAAEENEQREDLRVPLLSQQNMFSSSQQRRKNPLSANANLAIIAGMKR